MRDCDRELYAHLELIRASSRNLAAVENGGILPASTLYFREPVRCTGFGVRRATRLLPWIERALGSAAGADVVFLDPDIGIECRSASQFSPEYVFYEDMAPYIVRGQSLIVYQHYQREKDWPQRSLTELKGRTDLTGAWAVMFTPRFWGAAMWRAYLILPNAEHETRLKEAVSEFLRSTWGEHFKTT